MRETVWLSSLYGTTTQASTNLCYHSERKGLSIQVMKSKNKNGGDV